MTQPDISTRLRAMPSSLNDACRTMEEADAAIASLKSQVEGLRKALEAASNYIGLLTSKSAGYRVDIYDARAAAKQRYEIYPSALSLEDRK